MQQAGALTAGQQRAKQQPQESASVVVGFVIAASALTGDVTMHALAIAPPTRGLTLAASSAQPLHAPNLSKAGASQQAAPLSNALVGPSSAVQVGLRHGDSSAAALSSSLVLVPALLQQHVRALPSGAAQIDQGGGVPGGSAPSGDGATAAAGAAQINRGGSVPGGSAPSGDGASACAWDFVAVCTAVWLGPLAAVTHALRHHYPTDPMHSLYTELAASCGERRVRFVDEDELEGQTNEAIGLQSDLGAAKDAALMLRGSLDIIGLDMLWDAPSSDVAKPAAATGAFLNRPAQMVRELLANSGKLASPGLRCSGISCCCTPAADKHLCEHSMFHNMSCVIWHGQNNIEAHRQ